MDNCPVCRGSREIIFRADLLKKYDVGYYFCRQCGLLQTEEPYWLNEAYSSAISDADTGMLARSYIISRKLASLLYFNFDRTGKYLDVAGGYGVLTRLMRDIGFDFYWSDQYCQNIFAKDFSIDRTDAPFSVITAIEVLEHIYNPLEFIREWLARASTRTIIFSTELFQDTPPEISEWWYYSCSGGQHISFYQRRTLVTLAEALGLRLYSNGYMHMITDKNISYSKYYFLTSRFSLLLSLYVQSRLDSRTIPDSRRKL